MGGVGRPKRAANVGSLFKSLSRKVLVTVREVEESTRAATSVLGLPAELVTLRRFSPDADGASGSAGFVSIHPRPNAYLRS